MMNSKHWIGCLVGIVAPIIVCAALDDSGLQCTGTRFPSPWDSCNSVNCVNGCVGGFTTLVGCLPPAKTKKFGELCGIKDNNCVGELVCKKTEDGCDNGVGICHTRQGKEEVCPDCCPDCKLRECADPSICPQPEKKNILKSILALECSDSRPKYVCDQYIEWFGCAEPYVYTQCRISCKMCDAGKHAAAYSYTGAEEEIISNLGDPCGEGEKDFIGKCAEGLYCLNGICKQETRSFKVQNNWMSSINDENWISEMSIPGTHGYSRVLTNWMSSINDETWLSEMSIPGTHDTMTASDPKDNWCMSTLVKRCCVTQSMTLKEQLDAGIRFIDIRLKHHDNTFTAHHAQFNLGVNLRDILGTLAYFLRQNPTETVIMSYQEEDGAENNNGVSFATDFQNHLKMVENTMLYSKHNMPRLGEARGKIVLLDWNHNGHVGLAKNNRYVENTWSGVVYWCWTGWCIKGEYYGKLKANILNSQQTAVRSHFHVTWFSANDCLKTAGNYGGRKIAYYVNPTMHAHLNQGRSAPRKTSNGDFGVIAMDFPSEGLIKTIIENN